MAKTDGISFGTRAADNLILARSHDGRDAPVFFTAAPAPGVWRPTPPTFTPMLNPWLGAVTPLLVNSATQFAPPPPPSLTSPAYARDFAEVKAVGSKTSTVRSAAQTSTALFFSGNAGIAYNAAMRDQMVRRHLDLTDAARMFAAVDMASADCLITVWRAKLFYGLWRPITAINLADTDGNPATIADPSWVPLTPTPAYPEYSSGYNVVTAAFSGGLTRLFRTDDLDLTLTSTAVPDVRQYDSGRALRNDVVNARGGSDTTSARPTLSPATWACGSPTGPSTTSSSPPNRSAVAEARPNDRWMCGQALDQAGCARSAPRPRAAATAASQQIPWRQARRQGVVPQGKYRATKKFSTDWNPAPLAGVTPT
jgi:hypothetical protein